MRSFPFILLAFIIAASAQAGVVRTLDGRTLDGEIRLDSSADLLITPRAGAVIRLPLANVLSAQFKAVAALGETYQAGRWSGRDVGEPLNAGGSNFVDNVLTIRGSGIDIGPMNDQFYFVSLPLSGDGQIIARVSSLGQSDRQAKAGLMFRSNLDRSSPHAAAVVQAAEGTALIFRSSQGKPAQRQRGEAMAAPVWLKLVRRGETFSGYTSADGKTWEMIGTGWAQLPPQALAGLVVCSRNMNAICTATFEHISVIGGGAPEPAQAGKTPRGVVLRDSSIIAGHVPSFTATTVHLQRGGQIALPAADVSRIVFTSLSRELSRGIRPGRPGVILVNGDFIEGDLRGIEGGRINVSSVLLGLRRVEIGQAAAALLQDTRLPTSPYEFRLSDGSVIYADKLSIDGDALSIPISAAASIKVSKAELVEIKAGPARFLSLADLKPAKVQLSPSSPPGNTFQVDGTTAGLPMSLGGSTCQRGLGLATGTTVSYDLAGQYRLLSVSVGVPDGILPLWPVRFVIHADEKELYRSPPRTSLDDPLPLLLNVAKAGTLTLRIEPAAPADLGACGLYADPSLVK